MDIHRCRFVAFPPQPISAIAFSHSSSPIGPTPSDLRVAVGRERSGDVEIWNPLGGRWVQESVLRGSDRRAVEQLAWTQDLEAEEEEGTTVFKPAALRLFSIGGSTSIIEWDLCTGVPKRYAEGNYGDIWCFAAQPQIDLSTKQEGVVPSQALAAGCNDGSIVLFSTDDNDLRFSRILVAKTRKQGSKVLSLCWRDRNTIVAGYEDSTIRVIDVPSRTTKRTMTLGKPADGNRSVVWCVKCLPDGTILSGDSGGELKIWDASTLSLVQRLKTHQADVVDIAFNSKSDRIFTVGVDRRTVEYKLATSPGVKTNRWKELSHRRFHKHDLKCAVTYESEGMSILLTGGTDAAPVVMPIQEGQKSLHQTLPHLPQQPAMSSARRARLFIAWWQHNIHIYHVPKRSQSGQLAGGSDYSILATLQLKGDEHIQSATISESGRFVVACTTSGVRLFQLRLSGFHGSPTVRSRPIDLPPSLNRFGARLVGISPDSKWIYAIRPDNTVVLCKLLPSTSSKERPTIHRAITKLVPTSTPSSPTLGSYPSTICAIKVANDSRTLAVGTLSGTLTTWVLSGHEDTSGTSSPKSSSSASNSGSDTSSSSDSDSDDDDSETPTVHNQRWTLTPPSTSTPYPSLGSPILLLTFRPQTQHKPLHPHDNLGLHPTRHTPHPIAPEYPEPAPQLIAISAEHKLVELDVYTGKLTNWSRRNQRLPKGFVRIRDRVKGCFWDVRDRGESKEERLWLFGSSFVYMLNVAEDISPGSDDEKLSLDQLSLRRTWSTFIYRDILGAGVIGQEDAQLATGPEDRKHNEEKEGDGDVQMNGVEKFDNNERDPQQQIEVVIVERPMWDVEQPPRFDGGQDWET